jgi:HEAT repeat protein
MRALVHSALIFAGVGLAAGEPAQAPGGSTATIEVIELLSAIDFLPGTIELDEAMGTDLTVLTNVANAEEGDPGVRLRAYRSLGDYDNTASRDALAIAIGRYRDAGLGTELLYLIAAAEGLSQIAGPADVALLGPLLDSSSRDLRVVVARGLGHVGDVNACYLLFRRSSVEQVDQVKLAIQQAAENCP